MIAFRSALSVGEYRKKDFVSKGISCNYGFKRMSSLNAVPKLSLPISVLIRFFRNEKNRISIDL